MTTSFRTHVAACCAAAAALMAPRLAGAQQASANPHAGQWAAEAGFGGLFNDASLMRFSSAQRAWVVGVDAVAERFHNTDARGVSLGSGTLGNISVQVGTRWYRSAGASLRPYWGVGLLGGGSHETGVNSWIGGGYGEFGAAYFLAPHFSLGADGRLQLKYQHDHTLDGDSGGLEAAFGLVRVTAAVYF